jgi:hypothetical protein
MLVRLQPPELGNVSIPGEPLAELKGDSKEARKERKTHDSVPGFLASLEVFELRCNVAGPVGNRQTTLA